MIFQIIESGQVYLMILLRIGNWEIQKYHFKVNRPMKPVMCIILQWGQWGPQIIV